MSLTIEGNATVVGNSATGNGGGLYQLSLTGPASTTLQGNSAIHDNTADLSYPFSGGGIFNDSGSIAILPNATVHSNHPNDCTNTPACT